MAGGCVGGAHGDLTGGATGLSVVVRAVLDVTGDALDVIATLLVVHQSVPSFVILRHMAASLLYPVSTPVIPNPF